MINSNKFFLTTHDEDGKSLFKSSSSVSLGFLIGGGIGVIGSIILFYITLKLNIFSFIKTFNPMLILPIICLLVCILYFSYGLKIQLNKKMKVRVGQEGISIKINDKEKTAFWSEILEIKSTQTVIPTLKHQTIVPMIYIKTQSWKQKISWLYFPVKNLRELFEKIVDDAKNYDIKITDYMDWLPNEEKYHKSKMRGIKSKSKENIVVLIIGIIVIFIGLYINIIDFSKQYDREFFEIIFKFIMLIGAGLVGYSCIGFLSDIYKIKKSDKN